MTYGLIEPNYILRKEYIGNLLRKNPGTIVFGYADFDKALKNYIKDRVKILLVPEHMEAEQTHFEEYIKEQELPLEIKRL